MIIPNEDKKAVGTLYYMAPEILEGGAHGDKADWWSLGVILYLLSHGRLPFAFPTSTNGFTNKEKRKGLLKIIRDSEISNNIRSQKELKSLLCGLLQKDPEKRFGSKEILESPFFSGTDWDLVKQRKLKPPLEPKQGKVNFVVDNEINEVFGINKIKLPNITKEQQNLFKDWNWSKEKNVAQDLPLRKSVEKKRLLSQTK